MTNQHDFLNTELVIFPKSWEKNFYEEKVEAAYQGIRRHLILINEHERDMWAAIQKLMLSGKHDTDEAKRQLALQSRRCSEEIMYAIGRQLSALEANIRSVAACGRLVAEYEPEETKREEGWDHE